MLKKVSFGWTHGKEGQEIGNGSIDINYSFKVKFTLSDQFNSIEKVLNVGTAAFTVFFRQGVNSVAITLTGSGDITLMVGAAIMELSGITSGIVPDCALKEAYPGTMLMNDHMSGDFPILKPGLNSNSWYGNVTRVAISPGWRYL